MKPKRATISVEKASRRIGISYATGLKLAKSGELPVVKLGSRFLVLREPLERMLTTKTERGSNAA